MLEALARRILSIFGSLAFPKTDIWTLLRRNTMLSELLDELIEDSPFLHNLYYEAIAEGERKGEAKGREEGRQEGLNELRGLVRDLVRARFAELPAEELAGVEALADAERLHALVLALASAPDVAAARRAVAVALA
jgi:hypothetical protein